MSDTPQWYETDHKLMQAEIEAMAACCPEATHGFLPDGRMYWRLPVSIDVEGSRRTWLLLGIYRADHPSWRYGGSFQVYPVSPSYEEMRQMVEASPAKGRSIPHVLRDGEGNVFLSIIHPNVLDARRSQRLIASAASYLEPIRRWICFFEGGLRDPSAWEGHL